MTQTAKMDWVLFSEQGDGDMTTFPNLLQTTEPIEWFGLGRYNQDYSNKVCSAGKSCAPRDVTQGNPLRPSVWGFKMRYFPNIYGDFSALNYFSQDNKVSISL